MVFDEAKELLITRISNHNWHEADLMSILSDLECLPLAIIQVAAFIRQNEITVEQYLQALQLNNAEMNSFLSQEMYDRVGYRKAMGPQHLDVLNTASILASLYEVQSKDKGSRSMYPLVADIFQKSSGPQHESTLVALLDLAQFIVRQLNHEDAIRVFLRLFSLHE